MSSILYDAPGPRAKVRNGIITAIFAVILIGALVLAIIGLADKNVFTAAQWSPFVQGDVWVNFILPGLGNTLLAAGLSMIIALPIGALLAIARLSDHAWVRAIASVIVEFFRAIPVLLLMVFAWKIYYEFTTVSTDSIPLMAVVTGLVLYNGSVLAEVFRSGILALPKGQNEAAQAIGMRKGQIMSTILLPQAITSMLPVIVSQLVVVLKDTALGGLLIINFVELLRSAGGIANLFGNAVPAYIVIAAIYILLNLAVSSLAGLLEKYLRNRRGGSGAGKPNQVVPTLPGGATAAPVGDNGSAV